MSDGTTHPHDPSTDPATGPAPSGGPPPGWGQPTPGQPGSPAASGPPPGYADPAVGGPPPGWDPASGQPGGGPPPGYGGPSGYGPPGGYPAVASAAAGTKVSAGALLGLVSVVALAVAVSVKEDGDNGWGRIGVWAAFAIAAALVTLAPAVKDQLNLSTERAWQVAVAGAVGLAAFWVLFVLPSISQNVSFVATVGVAAGIGAVWLAPGRPSAPGTGQTW